MDEQDYTPVAWSISQLIRTMARECALHLQGYDFGKPNRTMCGRGFDGNALWDFDAHAYPPSQFRGCKRCEAGYRRWRKKETTP